MYLLFGQLILKTGRPTSGKLNTSTDATIIPPRRGVSILTNIYTADISL